MGAGEAPSPARNAQEEGGIINLFVADVLGTLLIHLDARAKSMRKPVGYTFLLNNLSHIRNTTASFHSDIIGPGAEDMLNKAFRDAKNQFMTELNSLAALLTPTSTTRINLPVSVPGTSNERSMLKDCATAFFDRLAELESLCAQYPLNRQDPDLRDRIGREAEDVVCRAWGAYEARCQGKGLDKYLRGGMDEVRRRVAQLFR